MFALQQWPSPCIILALAPSAKEARVSSRLIRETQRAPIQANHDPNRYPSLTSRNSTTLSAPLAVCMAVSSSPPRAVSRFSICRMHGDTDTASYAERFVLLEGEISLTSIGLNLTSLTILALHQIRDEHIPLRRAANVVERIAGADRQDSVIGRHNDS